LSYLQLDLQRINVQHFILKDKGQKNNWFSNRKTENNVSGFLGGAIGKT
jgi:hypothetical protein